MYENISNVNATAILVNIYNIAVALKDIDRCMSKFRHTPEFKREPIKESLLNSSNLILSSITDDDVKLEYNSLLWMTFRYNETFKSLWKNRLEGMKKLEYGWRERER
jgi:hypothetical protein